jgi:hypothetical protein
MKKLWIFGDSFSTPFNHESNRIWSNKYIEWKGYTPKIFSDILSEELNLELCNMGVGGSCNDTIFESIYANAHDIKKGDIIIIGWSNILRFRVATENKEWWSVIPEYTHTYSNKLPFFSKNSLDEMVYNRSYSIYEDSLTKKKNFIKWLFKNNIVIQWSPFESITKQKIKNGALNTLEDETNGEIQNKHYSEIGHKELALGMHRLINIQITRNII